MREWGGEGRWREWGGGQEECREEIWREEREEGWKEGGGRERRYRNKSEELA